MIIFAAGLLENGDLAGSVYCTNIPGVCIGSRKRLRPSGNGARTLSATAAATPGQIQLPIADQFFVFCFVLNTATYDL